MPRRAGIPAILLVLLLLGTAGMPLAACSSAPARAPARSTRADTGDSFLVNLTEWLKLDASQQEKVRRLVEELEARNAKIHENWQRGARVRPEELLGSRALFQRDLMAILREDQKQALAELRLKILTKGARVWRPGP